MFDEEQGTQVAGKERVRRNVVVDEVRDNKEPGCGGPSKSLCVNLGVFLRDLGINWRTSKQCSIESGSDFKGNALAD